MTDADQVRWHLLPDIELRTPVLALAVDNDKPAAAGAGRVWIGGVGGIAPLGDPASNVRGGDQSAQLGSPAAQPGAGVAVGVASVAALCFVDGWILAGGADGIVRYRPGPPSAAATETAGAAVADVGVAGDNVADVEVAEVQGSGAPVAALLALPMDEQSGDRVVLAATLGDGVLRSHDRGRTWTPTTFGLDDAEVSALCALPGGVLAGTASGIFVASPGVRAWRRSAGTDGVAVAAVLPLPGGDGTSVVAVGENGEILRSHDGGYTWTLAGRVEAALTAIACVDQVLIAGSADAGLWRSTDEGVTWTRTSEDDKADTVYCLGRSGDRVHAGTTLGLLASDDAGSTWQPAPTPPTHDLDRLLLVGGRPVVAGGRSGLVRLDDDGSWAVLGGAPFPLTGVAVGPATDDIAEAGTTGDGGRLLASGPSGLYAYTGDAESPWSAVTLGESGQVGVMSFRPGGFGLAAPAADGDHLLRTSDGGATWESVAAPFGAFPLTALQVADRVALAATSDPRQDAVQLWVSLDDGMSWQREARAATQWPIVCSLADPPVLSLGRTLCTRDDTGRWTPWAELDDGVRAVTGDRSGVVVLTGGGIWSLAADGRPQVRLDDGLPLAEVLDILADKDRLYVLLTGGRVWWRVTSPSGSPRSDRAVPRAGTQNTQNAQRTNDQRNTQNQPRHA